MKKSQNLKEVTCPHCQGQQTEPLGAISTNCRKCGRYFKLTAAKEIKPAAAPRAPKTTREVFCIKCGAPNLVAAAALSTQCNKCGHYLELGDKLIKGVQNGKLYAYDNVIFAEGCFFKGMEAMGRRLEVRGKVFSKLTATEEIVAVNGAQLSGELHAPVVQVERGAKVKVQTLTCERLFVSGEIEITGILTAMEIVLRDGATFIGKLHIPDSNLTVEPDVRVQFESIICNELTINGHMKLIHSLTAERIIVSSVGSLSAPTLRAARMEINVGGVLQGKIVKYVPREKPVELPDKAAEPQA